MYKIRNNVMSRTYFMVVKVEINSNLKGERKKEKLNLHPNMQINIPFTKLDCIHFLLNIIHMYDAKNTCKFRLLALFLPI